MGFRKCVHAPHSLQLGTAARYRKEMSLNHLLYIVLYVSKLYGPSVGGSSLVSSGLLSYKNIVECGRNCFDITNSQVVNFGFWVFWGGFVVVVVSSFEVMVKGFFSVVALYL